MQSKLDLIYNQITDHPSNQWAKDLGYQPIYRVLPKSKIILISQSPGRVSQLKNIAWQDASGSTLRNWLGVTEEEFYNVQNFAILPMDFYYPGKAKTGDLPPRKDFASLWHIKILEEMKQVKLIILIGSYAQRYYLANGLENLTQNVQNYHQFLPNYFPLVHPSPLNFGWRKSNPWFENEVVPDLKDIIRKILDGQIIDKSDPKHLS